MSVKYKAVPKGQPGVAGGGEIKFYASIIRDERVTLRTFLEEIEELNVVNSAVFFAVLETFLQKVNYYLINGRSVDLGQLGTFSPSISSSGEVNPEDINDYSIRRFKVNFRPSKILKKRLSRVEFDKVSNGNIEAPAP